MELREPWMAELDGFIAARLAPTKDVADAATAAQIRDAYAAASRYVKQKDAGLRLAARGFAEDLSHQRIGARRTTKRTYTYAFDTGPALVRLLPAPAAATS